MSVSTITSNPPCSNEDLKRLVDAMGTQPPLDYVNFLKTNDGARPQPNAVFVNAGVRTTITEFYGIAKIIRQKAALADRLSNSEWPIALTESGNFILLNLLDGWSIVFWDHELERSTPLAATFSELQSRMAPFSTDDVELAPEQVVSAWIDPSLLQGE